MCLFIDSRKHRYNKKSDEFEPLIASKSIPVIKVLAQREADGKWVSPYQRTECEFNRVLTAEMLFEGIGVVVAGLHACRTPDAVKSHTVGKTDWHPFHARIPKGAKYCIGDDGDIVSNKLIVTNKKYTDKKQRPAAKKKTPAKRARKKTK